MKLWMVIAISIFLAVYGGIHLYAYKKLTTVISSGNGWLILLFCFFILATLPVTIFSDPRFLGIHKILGWICYVWMGSLFLFVSSSLVLDLVRFIVNMAGRVVPLNASAVTLSPYNSAIAAIVLSLVISVHGLFAARRIRVERIIVPTSKIEESQNPFRIVQISDLHLGLLSDPEHFRGLLETIRSLEPDIVVSTGDLVDVQLDHLRGFADLFRELKPEYGKYAVTGNHEAFAGLDRSLGFMERAGFTMLSHDGVSISDVIHLAGVDDPAVMRRLRNNAPAEGDLLRRFPEETFTILLKHQPVVSEASRGRFDLQLSGHTHGGQIFPFILLTKLFYSSKIGLSRLGEKTYLYVSRGTGSWGPPIRFLAPPEVTVIELRSANGGDQDE